MSGIPEIHQALAAKYRRDYGLDYADGHGVDRDVRRDRGDLRRDPGHLRPGRRGRSLRALLRLLPRERRHGGRRPPLRDAPRARTGASTREELERAFTAKTRAILVNTPHNPTGKVFSREELEAIAGLCRERDVLCITDEVYEHLVYDGKHVPMATLPGMRERTITISSFGKTFSLTGWKIGWAAAAAAADRGRPRGAPVHHLRDRDAAPARRRRGARRSGRSITGSLRLLPAQARLPGRELARLGFRGPASGGHVLTSAPDFRPLGFDDDVAFCRHLIEKIGVAAIPPSRLLREHAARQDATSASRSARRTRRSAKRPRSALRRSVP